VELQPTLAQTNFQCIPQRVRFRFRATVADDIVSIMLERDLGMVPLHPVIERMVQKQIRNTGLTTAP
jgi:hypothetical protein